MPGPSRFKDTDKSLAVVLSETKFMITTLARCPFSQIPYEGVKLLLLLASRNITWDVFVGPKASATTRDE